MEVNWLRYEACDKDEAKWNISVEISNRLIPWNAVFEKVTVPELVKKFLAFYKTQTFITAFKRSFLSRARRIQCTPPHPISLRSLLLLSPYVSQIKSFRFPHPNPLFHISFSHTCYTPCHLILVECEASLWSKDILNFVIWKAVVHY